MISHFLNVSFTLPQALKPDKGQDYWWLHVIFPHFIFLTEQQGGVAKKKREVHRQPATILCLFIFRTRIRRFNRETVWRQGRLWLSVKEG